MNEKMTQMAEQTKALFPADATAGDGTPYHKIVDEKLEAAIAQYNNYMSKNDKFGANRVVTGRLAGGLNTLARIAYRKGYQSKIVEIK